MSVKQRYTVSKPVVVESNYIDTGYQSSYNGYVTPVRADCPNCRRGY